MRRMVGDEDPPKIPMTYPGEWLSNLQVEEGDCTGTAKGWKFWTLR